MNPASTGRDLQHVEIPGSDVLYGSRQPPVLDGAHCPTPLRADIPARATIVMPVPPAAGASAWTLRGRVPMVVAPKTRYVPIPALTHHAGDRRSPPYISGGPGLVTLLLRVPSVM